MKLENPFSTPNINAHRKRRSRLAKSLQEGIVILSTAPEATRNADSHYDYRWDSYFYYLSGFREPEAVLVMTLGRQPKQILFCRDKNAEREIWDGFRYGPTVAKDAFAFDECYSITELDARIPALMANLETVHTTVGFDSLWDRRVTGWLNAVRAQSRSGVSAPSVISDVRSVIANMRLVKDEHELSLMRRAGKISSDAHICAMRVAKPGMNEYEIEAEIIYEFMKHGARQPAYGSIVGSGANACILHYRENNAVMKKGDLLLIDAGCELESYAADITRTFPVGSKFSGPQRDIYELVLASQLASIAAVKPGAPFIAYHDAATKVLVRGLIDMKLCKGTVDSVIESETYKQFYMHRAGHWLGLDVHDAGDYKHDGKWRKLAPGMVLTVEPGLYIRPAKNVPKHFWNIGVRIEDDVLVNKTGNEVLTASCPKTINDVEALLGA